MPRTVSTATLLTVPLDPAAPAPLFRQLYDGLRQAILGGRLPPGIRLPATRGLARDLGVSRNTVLNAYEQLLAEGYLEGKLGSGTYVPQTLPEELLQVRSPLNGARPASRQGRSLSRRGQQLAATRVSVARGPGPPRPFRSGLASLHDFPWDTWQRLVARRWRLPAADLLVYGDPAGYLPLREAIAAHVGAARAVRCDAGQVIVVSGAQQALDLTAHVLLDPDEVAWVEDPCYAGARGALRGAGLRLVAVPVDADGLDVAEGVRRCPGARLAYVTPSHQYPLGVTLSLSRRLALLDWARRADAWVVEDDYDSEFRYAGRPLAALQGLDQDGRVIYVGTFSKALFPSLRLGYLVVPPDLAAAFTAARAVADRHAPTLMQAVVADFLAEGHFVRHVRRMRTLYAQRQEALVLAAGRELGGLLEVKPCETGMHLPGWLPDGVDDQGAWQRVAAAGLETSAVSAYRLEPGGRGALLLGYAAFEPRQLRDGVRRLAGALRNK
jgi:GntR family transcriptional regulator / MocR family aminotransferase